MSNLNELNDVLFETLRGVKEGNIDEKRAGAIVQLSNSIINNGKLQLSAYKFANSGKAPDLFGLPEQTPRPQIPKKDTEPLSLEEKQKIAAKDKHDAMRYFAIERGFKNAAEGISSMGGTPFKTAFEKWLEE